jgi:hypothetical protein
MNCFQLAKGSLSCNPAVISTVSKIVPPIVQAGPKLVAGAASTVPKIGTGLARSSGSLNSAYAGSLGNIAREGAKAAGGSIDDIVHAGAKTATGSLDDIAQAGANTVAREVVIRASGGVGGKIAASVQSGGKTVALTTSVSTDSIQLTMALDDGLAPMAKAAEAVLASRGIPHAASTTSIASKNTMMGSQFMFKHKNMLKTVSKYVLGVGGTGAAGGTGAGIAKAVMDSGSKSSGGSDSPGKKQLEKAEQRGRDKERELTAELIEKTRKESIALERSRIEAVDLCPYTSEELKTFIDDYLRLLKVEDPKFAKEMEEELANRKSGRGRRSQEEENWKIILEAISTVEEEEAYLEKKAARVNALHRLLPRQ